MIYMDNAATTAIRKEVAEAMLPYLFGDYGNPSGVYRLSEKAKNVVEESRGIIADIINADRNEIFFTSGGTEGDNWAVKAESLKRKQGHIIVSSIEHHAVTESALWLKNYGIDVTFAPVDEQGIVKLEQLEKMIRNDTFLVSVMLTNNEIGTIQPIENVCEIAHEYGVKVHSDAVAAFGHIDVDVKKLGHIIVSSIEHHAVTESALWLKNYGIDVTFAPVDEQGIVKLEQLEKMIRNDTFLVSVMLTNNEIGTIQPIENVCEIAHEYGVKVHSDAVAAFGHIDVDVKKLGVDFLNVSGHKICGPKGVGFLYVRGGKPERFMHGGGQENGLRAGTENVAGIAGLATAARIAYETLSDRARQEKKISDYMIKRILREIPYSRLNGSRESRVTGNMNFSFQYVNGGMLVVMLNKQGICASAGSACTSNSGKPSHVLLALGLDEKIAEGSLRLTINHTITHREADYVVECIKKDVARLRELA